MAPSIDSTLSFLCSEESLEVMYGGQREEEEEQPVLFEMDRHHLLSPSFEDAIAGFLEKEVFHAPRRDYWQRYESKILDARSRQNAVDWLLQAQAFFNFQPLTAVLSVNYLDRFLSLHQMPDGKTWMYQLLSVACLSLAAKMEETQVPLLLDLQIDGSEFIFEPRTIQRMEIMVLSVLDWRLSSVTPLSYIDHFIRRTGISEHLHHCLLPRIFNFVLSSLEDIQFLQYLSSEIAVAAFLCAIRETSPLLFQECKESLIDLTSTKDSARKCLHLMEDLFLDLKENAGLFVPQSPMRVLEVSFSCDSDSAYRSLESSSMSHFASPPATKKRRVDGLSSSPLLLQTL